MLLEYLAKVAEVAEAHLVADLRNRVSLLEKKWWQNGNVQNSHGANRKQTLVDLSYLSLQ